MDIKDPVEKVIADALDMAGIRYIHESKNKAQNLDFYLPDLGCFIECKAFYTDRTGKQIEGKQAIVIQGYKAAASFAKMIQPTTSDKGE